MMILDAKDKKIINKMLITSVLCIAILCFLRNGINNYELFLLYALCAVVGATSIKYTFVIMILSYTNVLSLFNGINMSGSIIDFGLISVIVCFIIQTVKYIRKHEYKCSKKIVQTALYVIGILFFLSISIFVADIRYGQPLIRGFFSFRYLLVIIYIFPFIIFLNDNDNGKEIIMNYLSKIVCLSIIIIIMQNIFGSNMDILKLTRVTRQGKFRILLHTVSPLYCMVFAYSINKMLENKKIDCDSILAVILVCIAIFIISRTRIYMAAIIGILLVNVYFIKNMKFITKVLITCILLSLFVILILSDFIPQVLTNLFSDVTKAGDNYIRNSAKVYYFDLIKDNMFIFGAGITNEKYEYSPVLKAAENGYFFVDIGIFGLFFEYGIFGILVVLSLVLNIFSYSLKIKESQISNLLKMFCLMIMITCYTVSPLLSCIVVLYIIMFSFMKTCEIKN